MTSYFIYLVLNSEGKTTIIVFVWSAECRDSGVDTNAGLS